MNVLQKFLNSRKFWAFISGLLLVLSTSAQDGVFTPEEIRTIAGLVIGYILSVAFEDGMMARVNWNSLFPGMAQFTTDSSVKTTIDVTHEEGKQS